MNTKRAAFVTLLLGIAASLLGSAQARADEPLTLKGAPAVSPATLLPGKDATVTIEVSTAMKSAKVVQLQIRLGTQVIGTLTGESLGANKTGKYDVKIAVPADASGSVTLAIWGQGLLIGNVKTRVGGAAPAVVLDNRSMAAASAATLPKIEMPAGQVRSLAVDASVMAGSSAQGTVTLEAPARYTGTEVSLTSSSPAASVPQNVRVAGGSTTATFPVMAVPGGAPGNVTISAVVAGPGGVAKLATLRVWGVEQVRSVVKISDSCPVRDFGGARPLVAGDACEVSLTLDSQTGEGGARVNLSSSRADVNVPASVAISPQSWGPHFMVTVAPGAGGGSATITAVADRPGGVPKYLTLALADSPTGQAQVNSLLLLEVVEPGLTYNWSVGLDGPAGPGGVSVVLNSSSPAVTVPSTVSVPEGALKAGFTARIGTVPPAGDVTLSAARSGSGNSVVSRRLKLRVIQVAEVQLYASVVEGKSSPASVKLDAYTSFDITVNLSSSNAAAVVPASVTIPANGVQAQFSVSAAPGAQPGTATISAVRSGPGNVPKEASLSIRLNQVWRLTFNPSEVLWKPKPDDGQHSSAPLPITGTVELDAPAGPGGVSVVLTANEGAYGVSVPASVLVPAGQSRVDFTATVGTQREGQGGSRSSVPITAVRSGQPASEAKTGNLSIVWY
jgi:trimeric autotransporter adhesin